MILADLIAFIVALGQQWLALMGGLIMLALTLYERFKRNAPRRLWLVLMAGFLMWAAFEAWKEEHSGKRAAEAARDQLQTAVIQKNNRIDALEDAVHRQPVQVEVRQEPPRPSDSQTAALRERAQSAESELARLRGELADRAKRREVRKRLGEFMSEGERLLALVVARRDSEPPQQEGNDWARRVEAFLERELDSSYIARFRAAGLPIGPGETLSERHRGLWSAIYQRVGNLNKFLEELHD